MKNENKILITNRNENENPICKLNLKAIWKLYKKFPERQPILKNGGLKNENPIRKSNGKLRNGGWKKIKSNVQGISWQSE